MKKKTGFFVVLSGESYEVAIKRHYVGYQSIEHAIGDAASYTDDGDKFEIIDEDQKVHKKCKNKKGGIK